MNQYQWTFLDNNRRRHTLGIAHGETSGHLVVHCDHRVVLIEFEVLEPRTFTFFVEDELCKFSIDGSVESGFTYDFQIDKDADTEVNRKRKKKEKRTRRNDFIRSILFFLTPALLLGALGLWGYTSFRSELTGRLVNQGIQAVAEYQNSSTLEFIGLDQVVLGKPIGVDKERLNAIQPSVGMRIPILFWKSDPENFIVDWERVVLNSGRTDEPTEFSKVLYSYLKNRLPREAGTPSCALKTALPMQGYPGLMGIIDGYALNDEEALKRWYKRFKETAYKTRLRQTCPPQVSLPSAEK